MSKGKKLEAESINDILLAAYEQRQSGLISAERTHGGRREKGELYVFGGQPIYARVGEMSGPKALNYLFTWRTLLFSFDAGAARPPANLAFRVEAAPSLGPSNPLPVTPPRLPTIREEEQGFIPHKAFRGQAAPLPPLTYRQRMIYFLIDGQRTLADLSRCSGRPIPEVKAILYELQRSGLIIMLPPNS